MRAVLILACCTVLAGCATTAPTPPTQTVSCPALKSYTPDQEKAAGAALQALPDGNPLVGFMSDYGALRAAVRACQSAH